MVELRTILFPFRPFGVLSSAALVVALARRSAAVGTIPQVPVPDVSKRPCVSCVVCPHQNWLPQMDSEDYTVAGTNKQADSINTTSRSKKIPFTILDFSEF